MSDKLQFVVPLKLLTPVESDKLKEALNKYREAVKTSSPGLPLRLPWGIQFQSATTPMGLRLLPCASTQRSRKAGNVGLKAATASRY
jgi:hypothetical protein